MRFVPSLYKKPWRLFKEIRQSVVKRRSRQFSSVEDFIVSGECYNCLCYSYGNLEIVITKCSYDWWTSNKSIHPIQNPLIISHVTHIRDNIYSIDEEMINERGTVGGKKIDREDRSTRKESHRISSLSTTNPTPLHLGQNLGRRCWTPATNRLSYVTVLIVPFIELK
jgi:hypothetical protein